MANPIIVALNIAVVSEALVFASKAWAAQGWDQLDHSALVKALELMANHEVAKA